MRVDLITIFPEAFSPLSISILQRAQDKGALVVKIWNLRDFSSDRHRKVDDQPYGGGKGMVLKCKPLFAAIRAAKGENPEAEIILTCPRGDPFTQETAKKLAVAKGMILVCGHYEGIDERVRTLVQKEISIGDYVLTGGELPAMVIIDAVARLLPGVLPEEAPIYDSFFDSLLDWPCYTRPEEFEGMRVPEVLLSGDHKKIAEWRKKEAQKETKQKRPDLYKRFLRKKEKQHDPKT